MTRLKELALSVGIAAIVVACNADPGPGPVNLSWHWPVFHWVSAVVVSVAVSYGILRYTLHHLRSERREDRGPDKKP
jgi:hypothetical protein